LRARRRRAADRDAHQPADDTDYTDDANDTTNNAVDSDHADNSNNTVDARNADDAYYADVSIPDVAAVIDATVGIVGSYCFRIALAARNHGRSRRRK
jgi:hypothetical protein